MKLNDEQVAQLRRLRSFRPFLIAWGAVHPETKEFRMGSATNMRKPNTMARKGWHVEVLK